MIYLDTAYIAKCYLPEPGAEEVQALARTSEGLCSSEWGRLEFYSVLHRHVREGRLSRPNMRKLAGFFQEDEADGVWTWLPVTSELLTSTALRIVELPSKTFVRSGDAVHLQCAAENGFKEIYSNDRHLLAAAKHFSLEGMNVL